MIRKLFFILLLLCLNSGCSMATLDNQSVKDSKETTLIPDGPDKENATLRRERYREMLMAKLERFGKIQ